MKKHWPTIRQFLIFGAGGGVNFVLNTGLTYFLTDVVKFYYLYAFIIVQIIIIIYGFFYNSLLTFRTKNITRRMFIKFLIFLHLFALVNIGLVKLLTDYAGIYYLYSIIITIVMTIVGRFFIYKKWVFNEPENKTKEYQKPKPV